ncbi:MAG TPA: MarR family transcriptional regulator [Phycisphaerae bacterium]|nr:MarR family transcriptional regulator [Phycisphaerae bacterium]
MASDGRHQELERLAEEIFELSNLGSRSRAARRRHGAMDLSESEFLTLDTLAKGERMTVGQLQRAIGVLPAQMSRVVRSLESKTDEPLIHCAINPQDRRRIDVTLTEAGRHAYHEYRESRLSGAVEVLAELKDRDRREFMRLLRVIRKLMEQRAGQADATAARQ